MGRRYTGGWSCEGCWGLASDGPLRDGGYTFLHIVGVGVLAGGPLTRSPEANRSMGGGGRNSWIGRGRGRLGSLGGVRVMEYGERHNAALRRGLYSHYSSWQSEPT